MDRIQSIDIFRGLTIFIMVFVNDVAGVSGLPAWMYHVPADVDGMTFVDIVFPAFLIIVGMSIPLAMKRRTNKGESRFKIAQHIMVRTVGLVVLGVYMVNAEEMNPEANLIPKSWWNILFYLSVIAVWNQYPIIKGKRKILIYLLQTVGIAVLIILALLFRKGEPGSLTGMTPSWWGILGLIGWAYLISTSVYLVTWRNTGALIAFFWLFIIIAMGLKEPDLQLPFYLEWLRDQSGHMIHSSLTISGIIITLLLQEGAADKSGKKQVQWILAVGAFCFAAGFFLRPFYGISKIYATPGWALYSIGWCCLVFAVIQWLVEIRGISKWAGFLKPAGTNPLLTYILPYIFYAAAGFSIWPSVFNQGLPGVFRSVIFSLLILWVAHILTRHHIRLRL